MNENKGDSLLIATLPLKHGGEDPTTNKLVPHKNMSLTLTSHVVVNCNFPTL